MPAGFLSTFVGLLTEALMLAFLARAILSWVRRPPPNNPLVRFLTDITEPALAPIRPLVPTIGALDVAALLALFVVNQAGGFLALGLRAAGL